MAQNQRKGQGAKGGSGGSNTAFYGVLAVIAVGGLVAIGSALLGGGGTAATELVEIDMSSARAVFEQAEPIRIGPEEAPVTVVEFGDFQCPGCGDFSLRVRPAIVEQYVNTGQVRFLYYDFPLVSIHAHAVVSARAARCAVDAAREGMSDGDAYWAMHDKLFEEQRSWAYKQGSVVGDFVDYAGEIGLDEGAFRACVNSDKYADVVTANRRLGDQLRISSTPTLLVNNRRIGAPSAVQLSQIIEAALGNTGEDTGEGQ